VSWLDLLLGRPTPYPPVAADPLVGQPLRYLIGYENEWPATWPQSGIVEVDYDFRGSATSQYLIAYCNLFSEKWKDQTEAERSRLGPYLKNSDTAEEYQEGQIDPRGPGWERNLRDQFLRRRTQGFRRIELDNPDAYGIEDVLGAIRLAGTYGHKVVAKNPMLVDEPVHYVAACCAMIVEMGGGQPAELHEIRRRVSALAMPVWFVAHGDQLEWARETAVAAAPYTEMRVTYSKRGEYGSSEDVTA
jgi:hypothetical protein